ncbi:MAG: TetR/AcrR family transcriptional regulator [Solirubrobacterales bacterium]
MSTTKRGRPPSHDREEALARALDLFWEQGYEATSIADLTAATGMAPPSLYAAFGSKGGLFEEVVELYAREHRAFMARALAEEPTLRAGIERMLREAAAAYTLPDHPRGCLVISAAVNCDSPEVRESLRRMRATGVRRLQRVIAAAIEAGELGPEADARTLALSVGVLMQGMAQQARDGATRKDLEAVATLAIVGWPWR